MFSENILIIVLIVALIVIGIMWNKKEGFNSKSGKDSPPPCDSLLASPCSLAYDRCALTYYPLPLKQCKDK
jgi:hypothetical protein